MRLLRKEPVGSNPTPSANFLYINNMWSQGNFVNEIKKYPKFNGVYKEELSTYKFIELKEYPKETVLLNNFFPLVNDAYPSKFNLSISEYLWSEMCKNNGHIIKRGVFDYTSLPEHSFWTITRNIRDEDLDKIIQGSNQHLLLFHIAGVGGFSVTSDAIENRVFYLSNLIEFFKQYIELSKLRVSYFDGGEINRHSIKKEFPKDINIEIYEFLHKKYGFSLLPTKNETFLSLKVFDSPIYWGYRNEFFLDKNNILIDIGTIEYLPYIPRYILEEQRIYYTDVLRSPKIFIGSGIGIERMMMAVEGVNNIWEISSIKPLVDFLRDSAKNKVLDKVLFLLGEALKVLYYLISERGELTTRSLGSKHRRGIVSKYSAVLVGCISFSGIDFNDAFLQNFLELNKKISPVDSQLSTYSKEKADYIIHEVSEQLRMYKVSPKYMAKVDSLIAGLVKS